LHLGAVNSLFVSHISSWRHYFLWSSSCVLEKGISSKIWKLLELKLKEIIITRPVTRATQGNEVPLGKLSPPLEKYVGHCLKVLDMS